MKAFRAPEALSLPRVTSSWRPVSGLERLPERARRMLRDFHDALVDPFWAGLPVRRGDVLVAIPARNERAQIAQTLDALFANCESAGDRDVAVAVVVNGTNDGTDVAVREWSARRRVRLGDGLGPGRRTSEPVSFPGLRLHLLSSVVGKISALRAVEEILATQGTRPEFLLQLDADAQLQAGALRMLKEQKAGFAAITGRRVTSVHDPLPNAHRLAWGERFKPFYDGLRGGLIFSDPRTLLSAYRAIPDGSATENNMIAALLRAAGLETAVSRVSFHSNVSADPRQREAQQARWALGRAQVVQLFGPILPEIALAEGALARVRTYLRIVARDARTLAEWSQGICEVFAQLPADLRLRDHALRSSSLELLDHPYGWMPPRLELAPDESPADSRRPDRAAGRV